MKRKISKRLLVGVEILLLAALVVLFIIVLDPKQLQTYIARVTLSSILGLLLFQFGLHTVGAFQLYVLLREAGIRKNPWQAFWARLSGCAVTSLTPSAYFGGEPVRAAMLKDESISYRQVFATIAVDKYIELFTKMPFAIMGFGFLIFLAHPSRTLVIICSVFVTAFIAFFFFLMVKLFQGGGFIMRLAKVLLRPLTRLRPRVAVKIIRPTRDFTHSVSHIIKTKKAFYFAMFLGLLLTGIELFQYYYVLSVLGIYSVADAAIIFFGHVFLGIFSIIPGNVGSMEGVFLFVFTLLGLGSDRSLIFSMIMRIGQLIMVGLGAGNILISRIAHRIKRGADRNRTDA